MPEFIENLGLPKATVRQRVSAPSGESEHIRHPYTRIVRKKWLDEILSLRHAVKTARDVDEMDYSEASDLLNEKVSQLKDRKQLLDQLNENLFSPQEVKINLPSLDGSEARVKFIDFTVQSEKPNTAQVVEKPTIVLLPGGDIDATYVYDLAILLGLDGERVVGISSPEARNNTMPSGFTNEAIKRKDYSLHGEVVRKTLEALGTKNIILVGTSQGAAIASETAAQIEQDKKTLNVNRLVLINPVGMSQDTTQPGIIGFIKSKPLRGIAIEGLRLLVTGSQYLSEFHELLNTRKDYAPEGYYLPTWQNTNSPATQILPRLETTSKSLPRFSGEVAIIQGREDKTHDLQLEESKINELNQTRQNPIKLTKVAGGHFLRFLEDEELGNTIKGQVLGK